MAKEIRTFKWPGTDQLHWECEYENGVENGHFRSWHTDGKPFEEGDYVNGKRSGNWKLWSGDGRTETILEMRDGVATRIVKKRNNLIILDKEIRTAYRPDGGLDWHCEYENGVRDGAFKAYGKSGRPVEEGQYVKGKREGNWKRWPDDDTDETETIIDFHDDVLVYEAKTRDGHVVEEKWYGPSGEEIAPPGRSG